MQSLTISLTEDMYQFIQDQVDQGRYGSADEYVRALIRNDREQSVQSEVHALLSEGFEDRDTPTTSAGVSLRREAEKRLESMLLEGLEGEQTKVTPEFWAALLEGANIRMTSGKKSG